MALPLRGLRLLGLAGLVAGVALGAVEELPVDEQCDGGSEDSELCGMSLRQMRGERLQTASLLLDDPTHGMRPISYNGMVPKHLEPLESLGAGMDAGVDADDGKATISGAEPPAESQWVSWDSVLSEPSGGDLFTFYMYRAVSDEVYPPVNVNAASLGGVLWYLHHEVVIQYPRKFGITRIQRFKVQMRAPKPLLALKMNFGPRLAFDAGQCTGPFVCGRTESAGGPKFCDGAFNTERYGASILALNGKPYNSSYEYGRFGYHVGCNKLGEYPFPMFKVYYPDATWYSLPGPCSSMVFNTRTKACMAKEPGGLCKGPPTGEGDCTWSYEPLGQVSIDDLVGEPMSSIHKRGAREYDPLSDSGVQFTFWNKINDTDANAKRMKALQDLFAEQYPNQTLDEDIPPPPCDFNFGTFYREFWTKDPFSGKCQDAAVNSACGLAIKWGMKDGIFAHPEWFPGLSAKSTFKEFQHLLYVQGKAECPYRPCTPGIHAADAAPSA